MVVEAVLVIRSLFDGVETRCITSLAANIVKHVIVSFNAMTGGEGGAMHRVSTVS